MAQPLRSSFILVPTSSSQSSSSSSVGGSAESESDDSPSSQHKSSSSFSSSSPPSNHLPVVFGRSKLTVILRPKTSTNPRLEEWARKFELEKQQNQWQEDLRYDNACRYEHQQEQEQPSQKRDAPAAEEADSDNRMDIHSSNKRQKKVSELSSSSYDDVNLSSSSACPFPPVRLSFRGQGRHGQNRQRKHDHVDHQTRRQNLPAAFALGSSSVPFPSSLMRKGQTLSKQSLFSSSSSKNLDHDAKNSRNPTTDDLLYREFLPPQDYNGGGKYWKDRFMFMQTIVKDTRKHVRDLEEDQRQLRARVHELEEQLLLQGVGGVGGRGSTSSSSSSRHFVDVGSDHDGDDDDAGDDCQGHYGTNNRQGQNGRYGTNNDGEKTDRGEDGNGQSTHPKTTKNVSNDHMDHMIEPPVPERCPSQLRKEGGRTKIVSIDAAADAAPGDRREGSSSSSFPPSVVVTCAQQHRVVSSCLYMTDGEGLSDDDNNDNGDECDSIIDESSSVM